MKKRIIEMKSKGETSVQRVNRIATESAEKMRKCLQESTEEQVMNTLRAFDREVQRFCLNDKELKELYSMHQAMRLLMYHDRHIDEAVYLYLIGSIHVQISNDKWEMVV
jgi:isocitrate/isopropylmalate dehydrogenase